MRDVITFGTHRVVITAHAVTRLLQRFRLLMHPHEREAPREFIEREFRGSYLDLRIELCPFYKTKLELKHGRGAFYSYSRNLKFMGNFDPQTDTVVIRSVVKRGKELDGFP